MIAKPIMISRYSCARRKIMIPFSISAMTSVPNSAPMAVPRPPVRLAPPTTAAAIIGGPGDPGLDISTWLYTRLVQTFTGQRDVIVVDQRGSGYSEPVLTCPEGVAAAYDVLDEPLTDEEAERRVTAGYAACRDRLINDGIDLSAYNTTENGADVTDLMDALGYEQYNLFGVSYGTRLALSVVRDHPERIRAVVLDSLYPPEADPVAEEPTNAAAAIEVLFDECTANPSCAPEYPDLEGTFWELVARLDTSPVTATAPPLEGTSHDAIVDGDFLIRAVVLALARTDLIPHIPKVLDAALHGDDAALSLFVETAFVFGILDAAYPVGLVNSVFCHEEAPFVDLAAYQTALDHAGRIGEGFGAVNWLPTFGTVTDIAAFCNMWQAGDAPAVENEPVTSDLPVLALQGELDLLTPKRSADQAAERLSNATVLEFPAQSHWPTLSDVCPIEIARQFIIDPTSAPNTSCIENMSAIRFWPPPPSG